MSGSAGGGGSAGASASQPGCREIVVQPTFAATALDEWARPYGGFINNVSYGSGPDAKVQVRGYPIVPTGSDFEHLVDSGDTECAWGGGSMLCASPYGAIPLWIGPALAHQDLTPIDAVAPAQLPSRVHWDGEAFAFHAYYSVQGSGALDLLRISTTGQVIQSVGVVATKVGPASSQSRSRVTTDPVTGNTFIVGGASDGLVLSAHDRQGAPLFPMGTVVKPPSNGSGAYPSVGTYGTGVLIVTQGLQASYVYRITDQGEVTPLGTLPLNDDETAGASLIAHAVVAHGPNDGWFVAITASKDKDLTKSRVVVFEMVNGLFSAGRTIVTAKDLKKVPPFFIGFDMRDPIAFEVAGQRWIGFDDKTSGSWVRLLRVDDPSCTYPPIEPP